MNVLGRLMRLAALVTAEVAAVVALHRLGARPSLAIPRHHLDAWLRTTAPADALVAVLRVVALVGAGWLLLATAAYALARLSRIPRAVRATRWATLPVVRRVVDAALAVSVAAGTVLAPAVTSQAAHAADVPPPTTSASAGAAVRSGHTGALASLPSEPGPTTNAPTTTTPTTTTPTTPTPTTTTPTTTTPATKAPAAARSAPSAPEAPVLGSTATIMVKPGDSLWDLAATQLAFATGRARADVPDAEIARYWANVCEANRARLLSGDPDLIYPGEVVRLPPVR